MPAALSLVDDERKIIATRTLIEGMNAMDAEEERRHQEKLARWTKDWEAQEEAIAQQEQHADVDKDVRRSGHLACGFAEKLSQEEMAKAAKISQMHVSRLLRYYRFYRFKPDGLKIPEGKFRAYWEQVRDPHSTMGRRKPEVVEAYER